MSKKQTDLQKAAGKLISSIQKEWGKELGEPRAELSENVMHTAHNFLQAGSAEEMKTLLGTMTIRQYLGEAWVRAHPKVQAAILTLDELLTCKAAL